MAQCEDKIIFLGRFVSPALTHITIHNGYLSVENGKITSKGSLSEYEKYKSSVCIEDFKIVSLSPSQFLIPGFVDCHVHAPQFPNIGLGLDRPLLEWLNKYTFPLESEYKDRQFAANVYNQVVTRLIKNGTTAACYFGSLHLDGTVELAKRVAHLGQRALVGKVSMNVKNDAGYYNSTEDELRDVETFITTVYNLKYIHVETFITTAYNLKNDLVQPIITPRFALSCDGELMTKLSALANKYNCRIQSHISENVGEIECVLDTFKEASCYADVYDRHGILTDKCIMAHAIHLSPQEMATLSERGVSVAHCPASNTRLMSGLCPLRKLLDSNINVGLGTDVSGGDSASILDALRRCMDVSSHLQLKGERGAAVSWQEAFYMATLGGAKALHLDNEIGDFSIGKDFDALLIDVYKNGSQIDSYDYGISETEEETAECLLQRFIYLGDDRNIEKVYIKGRERKNFLL